MAFWRSSGQHGVWTSCWKAEDAGSNVSEGDSNHQLDRYVNQKEKQDKQICTVLPWNDCIFEPPLNGAIHTTGVSFPNDLTDPVTASLLTTFRFNQIDNHHLIFLHSF